MINAPFSKVKEDLPTRSVTRRTDAGWRFDRLEVTPVALTEAPGRAL